MQGPARGRQLDRSLPPIVVSALALSFVLASGACGSSREGTGAILVTSVAPTQAAPPAGSTSSAALSGTVFVTTSEGTRPLAGGRVVYATADSWSDVTTDAAGRYGIADVPEGGPLRVFAIPPIGMQLFQRSATIPPPGRRGTLDVELVAAGIHGVSYGSPTLSGRVYYVMSDGIRPWPHTLVVYKSFAGPWYDAYATSDDDGRYELGRLPVGAGQILAGNCNDQMMPLSVKIDGDRVVDIDVTELATHCPGVPY
jgi:hypothetical protein